MEAGIKILEYFEEVETDGEYDGYFYRVGEALTIVVLGTLCGLRNVNQIHQWAKSGRVAGLLGKVRHQSHSVLLLAVGNL